VSSEVRQRKGKVGSGFVLPSEARECGKSSRQKCERDRNQRKALKQSRWASAVSMWGELLGSNRKTRKLSEFHPGVKGSTVKVILGLPCVARGWHFLYEENGGCIEGKKYLRFLSKRA